jgi:hypothetical protein
MKLAGHASQAAHNRYLANTRKLVMVPAEAMPQISIGTAPCQLPSPAPANDLLSSAHVS